MLEQIMTGISALKKMSESPSTKAEVRRNTGQRNTRVKEKPGAAKQVAKRSQSNSATVPSTELLQSTNRTVL